MAAVTVNSRQRPDVAGHLRVMIFNVDIAADADTLDTGLTACYSFCAVSPTNNAIGGSVSGGTITFQTGGAEAGAIVTAFGQ